MTSQSICQGYDPGLMSHQISPGWGCDVMMHHSPKHTFIGRDLCYSISKCSDTIAYVLESPHKAVFEFGLGL